MRVNESQKARERKREREREGRESERERGGREGGSTFTFVTLWRSAAVGTCSHGTSGISLPCKK